MKTVRRQRLPGNAHIIKTMNTKAHMMDTFKNKEDSKKPQAHLELLNNTDSSIREHFKTIKKHRATFTQTLETVL